jgi:hypothetical protein
VRAQRVSSLGSAFNPARPQDLVAHVGTADGLLNVATVVYGEIVDPSGDFNSDGVVDVQDMDLLGAEIASGANVVAFDLNGDSLVDITDRDVFLGGDLITSGNKLPGDADFDGEVQFPDFVILANNFAGSGIWSQGDFDVDGEVQFPDFVILANNFGLSAGAAAAVPEPSTMALVLAGAAALMLSRGGRCQRPKDLLHISNQ